MPVLEPEDFLIHHREKIQHLELFRLSDDEHKALAAFNSCYDTALAEHVARKKTQYETQYKVRLSSNSDFFNHYRRVVIEGDNYETAQRCRFHALSPSFKPNESAFTTYRNTANARKSLDLEFELPLAISETPGLRLVCMALSQEGEKLYHYLTRCINKAVQQQAAEGGLDLLCSSTHELTDFLNKRDSSVFDALFRKTPKSLPRLYRRNILPLLQALEIDQAHLAYTNGKPLEFIGSACIYNRQAMEQDRLAPEHCQALIELAAHHGSYEAAKKIKNQVLLRIRHSKTPNEVLQHYSEARETTLGGIIDRYKTVGQLLFAQIINEVILFFINSQHEAVLPLRQSITDQLNADLYHTILMAQAQEYTHRSSLRLCYSDAEYAEHLTKLFPGSVNDTPITSTDAVLTFLKTTYPHLTDTFYTVRRTLELGHPPVISTFDDHPSGPRL